MYTNSMDMHTQYYIAIIHSFMELEQSQFVN